MDITQSSLVLILITLLGATVNGALGYGFSSITVPVALLFYANRVLNPALVWVEVVLNAYVLWVNRASVPHVWRRVVPMIVGLAPGVVLGIDLHGRGILLRRHVFQRERRPAGLHPPEPPHRDPARRPGHTTRATGDLQTGLHELRRLGRGLRHLDTIATATRHRNRRRVFGPGRGGGAGHLAAVPILPQPDARHRRARTPASPRDSVEVRDCQGDGDLVLLPVECPQRGPVVPELRPHHGARPRLDVQRRRAAAELLPGVRGEAEGTIGACAGLVVDVVAAQRQARGRAEVVRDPAPERPPLRV